MKRWWWRQRRVAEGLDGLDEMKEGPLEAVSHDGNN